MSEMTITALVPWFGSNRQNAERPGHELGGCTHITIPFAGSMCELPHMPPKAQLYVCDLHDDLINLAEMVAQEDRRKQIAASLSTRLFHPKVLEDAQARLGRWRERSGGGLFAVPTLAASEYCETDRAADYFLVSWMGRSAVSGTAGELRNGLAVRGDGYGGDPVTRYKNATASLKAWGEVFTRCQFARESCWETIERVYKRAEALSKRGVEPRLGLYCDPPWPDDGDGYAHAFSEANQRSLSRLLDEAPTGVRVVIRYGNHPLIRELYPLLRWTWIEVDGRTQTNAKKKEVLIVNGPAYA